MADGEFLHIRVLHSSGALLDLPGALVLAIKDYKGGVLIISHNKARRSFA